MVIEVEHLWKSFQIPHERRTTLFENIVGMIRPNHYETYTVLKDISFEVDEGEDFSFLVIEEKRIDPVTRLCTLCVQGRTLFLLDKTQPLDMRRVGKNSVPIYH